MDGSASAGPATLAQSPDATIGVAVADLKATWATVSYTTPSPPQVRGR